MNECMARSGSLEDLRRRFDDPNQLGSLTEKEFFQVVRERLKNYPVESVKQKVLGQFKDAWEKAKKDRLAPKLETKTQAKEAASQEADLISVEDFYNGPWTAKLTEAELNRVNGILGTDHGFVPATDPKLLTQGKEVRVKPTESGLSQEAVIVGRDPDNSDSFLVRFVKSPKDEPPISVIFDMILVPPTQEEDTIEDAIEVVTPPSKSEANIPVSEFRVGDRVIATLKLPSDDSAHTILGNIVYSGIRGGKFEAGVFSTDLPDTDHRIAIVHSPEDLKFAEGELIARHIFDTTGFSPKDLVRIKNGEQSLYHVVGTTKAGDLELVPNSLFEDPDVKRLLGRIIAIQRIGSEDEQGELHELQEEVQKIFGQQTITQPLRNLMIVRKLKEIGKLEKES